MHCPTESPVPPPLPPLRRGWFSVRPSWLIAAALVLSVGLVAAEYLWLRARREARATARANERVAERIATARARMAAQHWEEAQHHLEAALAVERATNRAEVNPLLDEVHRGQADSLLEAASLAITHKNPTAAFRLLRAYLAHPQATNPARARRLRDDLEHAVSDDEAAHLLAHFSDEALEVFDKRGELTEEDGLHTLAAREIFKDTLRRNLVKERQKRAARREIERLAEQRRAADRARRLAHLRESPAFRDVLAFRTQVQEQLRQRQQQARRQEDELRQLFEQLNVKDPAEQAEIRADFVGRESSDNFAAVVQSKRAEIKRAYRAAADFDAADGDLFDRLVDQELDDLLRTLPMP